MRSKQKFRYISVEEYLRSEENLAQRHEYVDGRLFAMSGATKKHNIIAFNVQSALHQHVRGSGCRAYASDVKVWVEAANSFYYPDVVVSCGDTDQNSAVASNPVFIVEILSRATAAIDRREKVLAYKQIDSVKAYLIVHQSRQRVELHKRNDQASWDVVEFGPGDEIILDSMPTGPVKIAMSTIYQDVDWDHDLQVREDAETQYDQDYPLDW
jgi:Uma2 family endonuclease